MGRAAAAIVSSVTLAVYLFTPLLSVCSSVAHSAGLRSLPPHRLSLVLTADNVANDYLIKIIKTAEGYQRLPVLLDTALLRGRLLKPTQRDLW